MAKKVLIKKVSLDEIIDVFVDLYNKGVDYVDIVNSGDDDGKLSVVFTKEYMCKEMRDELNEGEEPPQLDEGPRSFSSDDINDLI